MEEALIKMERQSCFYKLLNEKGDKGIVMRELEHSKRGHNYGYCRYIKVEKVKGAIRRMHRG